MSDVRIDTRTFLEILDGTNKDYVLHKVELQPEFYHDPNSYSVEDYVIEIIRKSDNWIIRLMHEAYRGNIEDFCISSISGKLMFKHKGELPKQSKITERTKLSKASFKVTIDGEIEEEIQLDEYNLKRVAWGDHVDYDTIQSEEYNFDSEKSSCCRSVVVQRITDSKFFMVEYRQGPCGNDSDFKIREVQEKTKTIKYYE